MFRNTIYGENCIDESIRSDTFGNKILLISMARPMNTVKNGTKVVSPPTHTYFGTWKIFKITNKYPK